MKFDINETLALMMGEIKGIAADNWPEVKNIAGQFLQNRKERLELLASLRISGELSEEKFLSRLEDEKLIFEAEMHAIAVISKSIAQRAANAAIDLFSKAVLAAVKAAL